MLLNRQLTSSIATVNLFHDPVVGVVLHVVVVVDVEFFDLPRAKTPNTSQPS